MNCRRFRGPGFVAREIADQVAKEAFQQERTVSDPQQRLNELSTHIVINGFEVGRRVRHKHTGRECVIVAITPHHQLRIREITSRVPKQGVFAPDVFELID